ncbi:NADP-dependent oxidoreductase domain-containing protein 1 isoform X2 [Tiliqua scincoides]|uniref:NADP-dependent oxidoreductase domain-containing protein 1 isoform X2 n=1 Tax=Tiliqua scincoides TaxID=71010 RepID=UPI003462D770
MQQLSTDGESLLFELKMADIMANLKTFQPEYEEGTSETLLRLGSRAKGLAVNGCAHAVFFCKLLKATRQKEESCKEVPLYSLEPESKSNQSLKIGIIGGGHIGKQLGRALLELSGISGYYIQISTRRPETLLEFQMLGVDCYYNNRQLVSWADVVFLCCLPSHLPHICLEIQDAIKEHCIIYSLVTAIPLPRLMQLLPSKAILRPQYTFTDDDPIDIWVTNRTVVEALKNPAVLQVTCPCSCTGGIIVNMKWLAAVFYAALNSYSWQRLSYAKTLLLLNQVCFPENFVPASAEQPFLLAENFINQAFASSLSPDDTFPWFDLTTVQLKKSPFSQLLATSTLLQDNIALFYYNMMTENLGESMPDTSGIPLSAVLLKPPKALSDGIDGSYMGDVEQASSTDSEET